MRREGTEDRKLVDDTRHFVRRYGDLPELAVPDGDGADRFACLVHSDDSISTRAPIRRSTSMIPVRVGFRPTSATVTSEPASAEAATSQNAADEISPGTVSVGPTSRWPPASETLRSTHETVAPNNRSARSVWSRV